MKKREPKKLKIAKETLAQLDHQQLLDPQGGSMWGCSFQCPTSAGFCDHICY
jgi:hypothetical protein